MANLEQLEWEKNQVKRCERLISRAEAVGNVEVKMEAEYLRDYAKRQVEFQQSLIDEDQRLYELNVNDAGYNPFGEKVNRKP